MSGNNQGTQNQQGTQQGQWKDSYSSVEEFRQDCNTLREANTDNALPESYRPALSRVISQVLTKMESNPELIQQFITGQRTASASQGNTGSGSGSGTTGQQQQHGI